MNNFTILENKGREQFKSFLDKVGATDQQPTEDQYNPVDYYFTYKGQKVVAEIKVRDKGYENYPTHIIEENKLKSLLKAKEEDKCDFAYYVCFFGETAYWYNTTAILNSTVTEYLYCNATTAENNGKQDKLVRMIPTSIAKVYEKIDGV